MDSGFLCLSLSDTRVKTKWSAYAQRGASRRNRHINNSDVSSTNGNFKSTHAHTLPLSLDFDLCSSKIKHK